MDQMDSINDSVQKDHESIIKTDKDAIKNEEQKIETQTFCLPHNFVVVGQAKSDGDCFFDSFRQGLQQLGLKVTNEELRANCRDYAKLNPPEWFMNAIKNSYQNDAVRTETIQYYIEVINRSDRWGDPDIEGRILCEHYKIAMYLFEYHHTAKGYISQMINAEGCKCDTNINFDKENTIFIINRGKGHFQPVIKTINDANSDLHTTDNLKKMHNADVEFRKEDLLKVSKRRNKVIDVFNELEGVIKEGNLEQLNTLINSLYQIADMLSLSDIYNDKKNSIRETHIITLACKYNQCHILDYLLHKSNILYYLPNQGPIFDDAYLEAISYIIQLHDIRMLETLYDYWSGYVHCLGNQSNNINNDIIANLIRVQQLLFKASRNWFTFLQEYPQMLVDVYCLISFNAFQIEFFTELSKLIKIREQFLQSSNGEIIKNEVETIIAILISAFDVYKKYSYKNICLKSHSEENENNLVKLLHENSISEKAFIYCRYELYYRKLDYSIALIIIDNLHLLKLRLEMENNVYQEIEATLYYFLYCVNENWKYYLPETRPKYSLQALGKDKDGLIQVMKFAHDPHRFLNGPVIYLEWQKFKRSLENFITKLRNADIENNLRHKGTKLPKEEINNLTLIPYMRDDYSLNKMLEYLEQVSYIDINQDTSNSLLMIQRIIQIIGEFFKNTEATRHLSPTTLALLQNEIPKITYKYLFDLRDSFSHAREGKLLKRIDLENTINPIFHTVLQDLKEIKKAIHKVIHIYNNALRKSVLSLGSSLIQDKIHEIPNNYNSEIQIPIKESTSKGLSYGNEINVEKEYPSADRTFELVNILRHLYSEISTLANNSNMLLKQWSECKKDSIEKLKSNISQYTSSIKHSINIITEQNNSWDAIKNNLQQIQPPITVSVLNYPNKSCIENIKNALKNIKKGHALKTLILEKLRDVKDCNAEWIQIVQLINFIVLELGIFEEPHLNFTNKCKEVNKNYPDKIGIDNVIWLIDNLSRISISVISNNAHNNDETYKYVGIRQLGIIMQTKFFITTTEMTYLKNNSKDICKCVTTKICCHQKILEILYHNKVINEKEYENITSINLDDRCKKIIKNLTNGNRRENNMLECLVSRTNHLICILGGERDIKKLILRYRHDVKFRITMEMIVSDIMNIFAEGWLVELVNTSYTKLLAEYPLRNILEHGNPLLEISNITLDANDFPSALMKFALDVVEDKSQLDDLFTLYEADVDRADVFADLSNNLNMVEVELVNNFKKCTKWESYVKLLPQKTSSEK